MLLKHIFMYNMFVHGIKNILSILIQFILTYLCSNCFSACAGLKKLYVVLMISWFLGYGQRRRFWRSKKAWTPKEEWHAGDPPGARPPAQRTSCASQETTSYHMQNINWLYSRFFLSWSDASRLKKRFRFNLQFTKIDWSNFCSCLAI